MRGIPKKKEERRKIKIKKTIINMITRSVLTAIQLWSLGHSDRRRNIRRKLKRGYL